MKRPPHTKNSITAVYFHGQRMTVKQNQGRFSFPHRNKYSALKHNGRPHSRRDSVNLAKHGDKSRPNVLSIKVKNVQMKS